MARPSSRRAALLGERQAASWRQMSRGSLPRTWLSCTLRRREVRHAWSALCVHVAAAACAGG